MQEKVDYKRLWEATKIYRKELSANNNELDLARRVEEIDKAFPGDYERCLETYLKILEEIQKKVKSL